MSHKTGTRPGEIPWSFQPKEFFPLPRVAGRGPLTRNSYANRRASRPRSGKVTTAERGRRTKGSEQTCRPADNATEEKTGRSLRSAALTAVFILHLARVLPCTLPSTAPTRQQGTCPSPTCHLRTVVRSLLTRIQNAYLPRIAEGTKHRTAKIFTFDKYMFIYDQLRYNNCN